MESLHLSRPLTLKCGLTIPNRLVKSALAEKFATRDSLPASKQCLSAYEEWADGGWGMVITGRISPSGLQVHSTRLTQLMQETSK
jgi:2,4-dienoyl-CoA reductase-like NADH-dependent reductase (Old Yellow Enzyme family)